MSASASEQARGIAVLLSWLKAVGEPGILEGREIKTSKGSFSVDDYNLAALAANGLEEFHKVTQKLGVGQPIPVNRGVLPQPKDLDFDLVAFRHTEYRAAPDLTVEELSKYNKCISNCVNLFYRANKPLLGVYGMGKEDLRTYAIVWTANFCHRYQKDNDSENKKLLTSHLKQRFSGLRSLMLNRVGDVTIWADPTWADSACAPVELEQPVIEPEEAHSEAEGPILKRRAAKKALNQHLDTLGPEKAKELLEGFVANIHVHPDVRLAARQLLEARTVRNVDEQT